MPARAVPSGRAMIAARKRCSWTWPSEACSGSARAPSSLLPKSGGIEPLVSQAIKEFLDFYLH